MKIAVFATGWNGEYLRDMYHGLENSQKEFHDSIHLYASFGRLGSGDSFNKSEFDFFELADIGVRWIFVSEYHDQRRGCQAAVTLTDHRK